MNLKLGVTFVTVLFAATMYLTHYRVALGNQQPSPPASVAHPQLEGKCYVRVEEDGTRTRICENVKKGNTK